MLSKAQRDLMATCVLMRLGSFLYLLHSHLPHSFMAEVMQRFRQPGAVDADGMHALCEALEPILSQRVQVSEGCGDGCGTCMLVDIHAMVKLPPSFARWGSTCGRR